MLHDGGGGGTAHAGMFRLPVVQGCAADHAVIERKQAIRERREPGRDWDGLTENDAVRALKRLYDALAYCADERNGNGYVVARAVLVEVNAMNFGEGVT